VRLNFSDFYNAVFDLEEPEDYKKFVKDLHKAMLTGEKGLSFLYDKCAEDAEEIRARQAEKVKKWRISKECAENVTVTSGNKEVTSGNETIRNHNVTVRNGITSTITSTSNNTKNTNTATATACPTDISKSVKKSFSPPSFEEVSNYCKEKNYTNFDVNFYFEEATTANWVRPKAGKIKNWKLDLVSRTKYDNYLLDKSRPAQQEVKQSIEKQDIFKALEDKKEKRGFLDE
jgi:hypothetical protein